MADIFVAIDAAAADDTAGDAAAMMRDDPQLARVHGGTDGVTPVLHAMYQQKFALARSLADAAGALDLAEAAAIGDVVQVRDRLASGVGVDSRTPDGFTPLHLAAFFGAPTVVAELIGAGADLDAVAENAMRVQPLHAATAGRHGDCAALLIDAGADVNGAQRDGYTPLHSAAANGDAALVDRLLAAGAAGEARNDDGQTAADLASAAGHQEVAARLG